VLVLLALAAAGARIYYDGIAKGQLATRLAATEATIQARETQIRRAMQERDAIAKIAAAATARSDSTRKLYTARRIKVVLVGDTARVDTASYVLPGAVADLIRASDVHVAALEAENGVLHQQVTVDTTLIVGLQAQLADKDKEIQILKQDRSPRCGAKCGAVIGAASVLAIAIAFF
jgi:hypothetical protein